MTIFHNISDGKYKNTAEYYSRGEDKEKNKAWHQEENRMVELFRDDVKKELGITDNPKADKLMAKAWEMGHSSGYNEVYNYAMDLVELIED